ncbi:MAG: methyltransferase domain-containing protein [Pseudomonadota bacterium]
MSFTTAPDGSETGLTAALDRLYDTKFSQNKLTLSAYSEIYDLPVFAHNEEVNEFSLAYASSRTEFVALLLYDKNKKVLLELTNSDRFSWSIPIASVGEQETFLDTVLRLARSVSPKLSLYEIEPVALIKNTFTNKGQKVVNDGVVFMARIDGDPAFAARTSKHHIVELSDQDLEAVRKPVFRSAIHCMRQRLTTFDLETQQNEIEHNEAAGARYVVHNRVIKKFFLTKSKRKKLEQSKILTEAIQNAGLVLDVSAGDSAMANEVVKRKPDIRAYVANDLALTTNILSAKRNSKIMISNHDATNLPFRSKSFDFAICMNTLHHMPGEGHIRALLNSIRRVAKRALIWDFSDPKSGTVGHRAWNFYYKRWLKDQAQHYLSDEHFRDIISSAYQGLDINFSEFYAAHGKFNYALIEFDNE